MNFVRKTRMKTQRTINIFSFMLQFPGKFILVPSPFHRQQVPSSLFDAPWHFFFDVELDSAFIDLHFIWWLKIVRSLYQQVNINKSKMRWYYLWWKPCKRIFNYFKARPNYQHRISPTERWVTPPRCFNFIGSQCSQLCVSRENLNKVRVNLSVLYNAYR